MCGIVGGIAQRDVAPILIEGLKRLEYRGYDSAGMAVVTPQQQFERVRKLGKVKELDDALQATPLIGHLGIAHTRWATHGAPSEPNAHPHISGNEVALVHNGIIENHQPLKERLIAAGYRFESDTDTEVIAHLIHSKLSESDDLIGAVNAAVQELEGAYAIGVMSPQRPDELIACRRGSPLIIGIGIGEHFIASDIYALLPVTRRFIYLEEGDFAHIKRSGYRVWDERGNEVTRPVKESQILLDQAVKGEFKHFMMKEIHEQPTAIADTLEGRLGDHGVLNQIFGPGSDAIFDAVRQVHIIACGTSYHAGYTAKYWLESIAGVACHVEVASEYRYRDVVVGEGTLFLSVSQSGETADTLAALRIGRERGYCGSLAICNVPESSLVRESDLVLMTHAGPEIGVASTKAFTTQLTALMLTTLRIARARGLSEEREAKLVDELRKCSAAIDRVLALDPEIARLAEEFVDKEHALFLGRGIHYPIALEGALKLKEISYIHAEAYPAGELKHGPLALIDTDMPVVVVAPHDDLLEKLKSNLQEVRARGGQLYIFADPKVDMGEDPDIRLLRISEPLEYLTPILYTIPLQLLAYHVAVLRGTDVDQPRNLAKSVTVE